MRNLIKINDNDPTPTPPAAGQFGISQGVELRRYRPQGCPSLEQFEARFRQSNDEHEPPQAA